MRRVLKPAVVHADLADFCLEERPLTGATSSWSPTSVPRNSGGRGPATSGSRRSSAELPRHGRVEAVVGARDDLRLFEPTSVSLRMRGETGVIPAGLVLGSIAGPRRPLPLRPSYDADAIFKDTFAAPSDR